MMQICVIARREMAALFSSPVGYLVGAVFSATAGLFFYLFLVTARTSNVRPYFATLEMLLVLVMPFITMGSIAEERRARSLETLLVRPLTEGQIITGKFLGATVVGELLVALAASFLLVVAQFGSVDWGYAGAHVLGLALIVVYVASFGIALSAYADSQLLAGLAGLFIGVLLWLQDFEFVPYDIRRYFAPTEHLVDFRSGVVNLTDVLFFLSWGAIWLTVAATLLSVRRR